MAYEALLDKLKMTEKDRTLVKTYFKLGNVCGTIGDKLIRKLVQMDEDSQKRELQKFGGWRLGWINAQLEKLNEEKKKLESI
jgi:hypothetical protein